MGKKWASFQQNIYLAAEIYSGITLYSITAWVTTGVQKTLLRILKHCTHGINKISLLLAAFWLQSTDLWYYVISTSLSLFSFYRPLPSILHFDLYLKYCQYSIVNLLWSPKGAYLWTLQICTGCNELKHEFSPSLAQHTRNPCAPAGGSRNK